MKPNPKTALLALVIAAITLSALPAHGQLSGPVAPYKRQPAAGSIQIDVDMVLVNVGVSDAYGHLVSNLEKQNFRLLEDSVEQEILTFSTEDVPASIGILFDTSGSMSDKMDASRQAVAHFLKASNPQDEFFVIGFNDRAELTSSFTSDIEQVQARTLSLKPKGRTAFLDAVYFGLAQLKNARHDRHILLVISDGGDNHSRHHEAEIRNLLRESDCQLYALGIFDAQDMKRTAEERYGPSLLSELGEMTGGHVFPAASVSELVDLSEKIGAELRNQYVLGYKPVEVQHDGRWRRIKVAVKASSMPPNGPPLTARARTGYYSPRD
jgi:Ca-activated chloride channel family protein